MTSTNVGTRTTGRRSGRTALIAATVVVAALVGTVGYESATGTTTRDTHGTGNRHETELGAADGVVDDSVAVGDDVPAVTELDADLLDALRRAARDARDDDVTFYVTSGWRSRAYQEQLLREAVSTYGSRDEAARWVATADTSAHVRGEAVDVGHADATAWLSAHGAEYGLCRIYDNEPWHFELRDEAPTDGCPARYADPTEDPRMQ